MSKTHPPYAPEYRRQMVELVHAGRTPGELAREYECSAQAIRNWVRQTDRDEGRREDGLSTAEREELRRLRRENRQLREEREILKNGPRRRLPGRMETSRATYTARGLRGAAVSFLEEHDPAKKRGSGTVADLPVVPPFDEPD